MADKVLIIDDELDYRIILRDTLGENGFQTRLSEDGEEGLKALREFKPDLVLLDWNMPKVNGEKFVSVLRSSEFANVPVIMLTVMRASENELEALHFGVDDYVTKPFKPEDLLARIRAVLRRARA